MASGMGEAGLFLRTPFTEGCDGVNYQTSGQRGLLSLSVRTMMLTNSEGRTHGMVWYGMVDACDGYLAAEASGSSFG